MIDVALDADATPSPLLTIALVVGTAMLVVIGAGYWGYRTQAAAWPVVDVTTAGRAVSAAASGATTSTRRTPGAARQATATPEVVATRSTATRPGAGAATAATVPLTWPLWEFRLRQPVPPRNPPLTPVNWRLIGANRSDTGWSIIVVRQGKSQPEYFKVGDSLPGGYQVQAITEEDVTLVKDKRPVVLSYIGSR